MSEQLAWLAGLLEGEACFDRPHRKYNAVRVKLCTTDKDVVERASLVLPTSGKVREVNWRKNSTKQPYEIAWCGDNAVNLMKAILPYMGTRRTTRINELLLIASRRKGKSI